MKNKQVEELFNNFQEILDNPTTTEECYDGRIIEIDRSYDLEVDEIKLLLSYIRELEEENKELKDIADEPIQIPNFLFDMSQELKIDELEKELQTTANKCKQLENKIKILEEQPCFEVDDKTFCFTFKKWKCSEVIKLSEKIEQLENNRDKAIEVITNLKPLTEEETGIKEMLKLAYSADNIKNLETSFKTICHLEDFEIAIWNIKDILKGDSDE